MLVKQTILVGITVLALILAGTAIAQSLIIMGQLNSLNSKIDVTYSTLGGQFSIIQGKISNISNQLGPKNVEITVHAVMHTVVDENTTMEFHTWIPNTIVIHKGDTVKLTVINDDDHIHGFGIPDFGIDTGPIQPGQSKTIEFVATKVGTFEFMCTTPWDPAHNICDRDHPDMRGILIILP